jgi:hypothetical protein
MNALACGADGNVGIAAATWRAEMEIMLDGGMKADIEAAGVLGLPDKVKDWVLGKNWL